MADALRISSSVGPSGLANRSDELERHAVVILPAIVGEFGRGELVGEAKNRNVMLVCSGFRVAVERPGHSHSGPDQVELGLDAVEEAGEPRLRLKHVSVGQTPAKPVFLGVGRQEKCSRPAGLPSGERST